MATKPKRSAPRGKASASAGRDPSPAGPALDWLPELLKGRPNVEREDFIAALLLNAGFEVEALSTPLQALLERFAIRADIEPGPPAKVNRQIAEYFALHPLAPDLVQAFEKRFRADLLAQDPAALRAAMTQLGREVGRWQAPQPAPEGSHKGGALGFFAARAQFDDG